MRQEEAPGQLGKAQTEMKQKQGNFLFTYKTRKAGSRTIDMRLKDQDLTLFQGGGMQTNLKFTATEEMRNVSTENEWVLLIERRVF